MTEIGFMDVIRGSQWIDLYEFTKKVFSPHEQVSSFVYIQETTGSKSPNKLTESQSPPVDALIAIPVVLLHTRTGRIGPVDFSSFHLHPWEQGIYPASFKSAAGYRFELLPGLFRLTVDNTQFDIPVDFTERFQNLVERLSCFTLLIEEMGVCTGVTFSNKEYPQIGLVPILLVHAPKKLSKMLDNPRSVSEVISEKLDLYLDRKDLPSGSEYRTYESNRKTITLPKIQWNTYCVCCSKKEVSREHCTPAWLCRLLGVEPVVADIFCQSCNTYFGKTLEEPIAGMCTAGVFPASIPSRALDLMTRWFVKTALTVALASGVRFDLSWFDDIRSGRIPEGLIVEYSASILTNPNDPLYTFGVSHFSESLHRKNTFLFTFACPYFSFYVRRSTPHIQVAFMHEFWPSTVPPSTAPPELESHADFHEIQHLAITGEATVHVPIVGRKAAPRN